MRLQCVSHKMMDRMIFKQCNTHINNVHASTNAFVSMSEIVHAMRPVGIITRSTFVIAFFYSLLARISRHLLSIGVF